MLRADTVSVLFAFRQKRREAGPEIFGFFGKICTGCSVLRVLKVLWAKGGEGMQNRSLRADDWIEEMMERSADMVYRLAYAQVRNRQDADDIFQEVFI